MTSLQSCGAIAVLSSDTMLGELAVEHADVRLKDAVPVRDSILLRQLAPQRLVLGLVGDSSDGSLFGG